MGDFYKDNKKEAIWFQMQKQAKLTYGEEVILLAWWRVETHWLKKA